MVRRTILVAVGLVGLAASGCGSSYSATLSGVTPMPDGSFLGQAGGHLHTGIATAFTPLVSMHDTWGTHSETDGILVSSSDPGVLQAAPVTANAQGYPSDNSTGSPNGRWIIWAVAPGSATLTVWQSGNVASEVQVQVTDPQ